MVKMTVYGSFWFLETTSGTLAFNYVNFEILVVLTFSNVSFTLYEMSECYFFHRSISNRPTQRPKSILVEDAGQCLGAASRKQQLSSISPRIVPDN